MVFNITVLQKLIEAKVDLFEIIKNNHQFILNCFTQVIKQCSDAKKTVEPIHLPYIQNVRISGFIFVKNILVVWFTNISVS